MHKYEHAIYNSKNLRVHYSWHCDTNRSSSTLYLLDLVAKKERRKTSTKDTQVAYHYIMQKKKWHRAWATLCHYIFLTGEKNIRNMCHY